MKCPQCEFDNPQDIHFCGQCGIKLKKKCPRCSFSNPPRFVFCGECGIYLRDTQTTPSTSREKPTSYTPKFLAEKILKNRNAIEGEHKIVTVLFADLASYTSISEKLSPEIVHDIMDGCFAILMDAVHHYEGTVNQFLGDGIMALFGAPVAHEDHARRSCYAALAIQKAIEAYGNKIERETGFDFKMRIGLNSGPVIVGAIGDDLRMDYTAVGDTTNLGARMAYNAKPGSVLVSRHTHRLVRDFFKFRPLGKVRVKGKQELQKAYELLKPSEIKTRIGASVVKGLTRFVGRKHSIPSLLNSYEQIKSGAGLVVGLVGEAGVGKSRLLLEMRRRLPPSEYTYLEGRCLQYGNSLAYLPILDILRLFLHINEEDGEAEIKKKLSAKLLGLDESFYPAIPSFQALLSLNVEDEGYTKLEPVEKRARTFDALKNLLMRLSQEKHLIIAIEDMHWVDKTSEEFLDFFIAGLANMPILLILVYRPQYSHRWGSKSYYKRIGVTQLGTESSSAMVRAILKDGKVDEQLIHFILNRSSGNPLFMEEFIFTLLENGSIIKVEEKYILKEKPSDIQIPSTVQGIIAARLDHLEANLKRTMQVASVIGRNFAYRILQATMGLQEDLKTYLMNLQSMELISEKNFYPELEYIFKHALIQEVAYNSLLPLRKKDFHRKVGEAMKTFFGGRVGEYASLIGDHFMRGEAWESAYEYLLKAGDDAARLYAHAEARLHYARAIEALAHLRDTKENRRRKVDAVVKQTLASWRADSPEQNLRRLQGVKQLADALAAPTDAAQQDQLRLARIRFWMGRVHYSRGEMEEAIGLFRQVLPVAQKFGDEELLSIPAGALGQTMAVLGHLDEAAKMLGQAISIFELTANWTEWIQAKAFKGTAVASMGRYHEGLQEIRQALSRAEELDFLPGICVSHNCFGYAYLFGGELDKAIEASQAAVTVAGKSGDRIYAYVGSGITAWAACRRGLAAVAASHLARCGEIAQELGGRVIMGDLFSTAAAEIALKTNKFEKAVSLAKHAVQNAKKINGILSEGIAHKVWARALYAMDTHRWDAAQEHLAYSVKILASGQNTNEMARTHVMWGLLCADQGQGDAAQRHWQKAFNAFESAGLKWDLERVRELLET